MTCTILDPAEAAARPELRRLYESAFPDEERIPWDDLLRLVREMPLEFAEYRDGEELLGLTIVYPRPRLSWFWYFAVPEERRGRGIGQQIAKQLAEQGAKADTAIQGVKVNGTEITPDAQKKVNLEVATKSDATLTPIYSDTPTFSEWTFSLSGSDV